MYLVSLYFDDKAAVRIESFINKVSEKSGNTFMTDNNVPPHITIASFQTNEEEKVIKILDERIREINRGIITWASISISKYYLPFQWMPHTTIAKKLAKEELILAFEELEKNFNIFSGEITKIALSKTNPYEDIIVWNLDNK